ncbi:MAG: hypothetical protein AAFV38_14415, partial [Pseudomonadota bacterium]
MRSMRDDVASTGLPFLKMHGLGNDFVVLDLRATNRVLPPALVRAVADRRRGVGFDQLALIYTGTRPDIAATRFPVCRHQGPVTPAGLLGP